MHSENYISRFQTTYDYDIDQSENSSLHEIETNEKNKLDDPLQIDTQINPKRSSKENNTKIKAPK